MNAGSAVRRSTPLWYNYLEHLNSVAQGTLCPSLDISSPILGAMIDVQDFDSFSLD